MKKLISITFIVSQSVPSYHSRDAVHHDPYPRPLNQNGKEKIELNHPLTVRSDAEVAYPRDTPAPLLTSVKPGGLGYKVMKSWEDIVDATDNYSPVFYHYYKQKDLEDAISYTGFEDKDTIITDLESAIERLLENEYSIVLVEGTGAFHFGTGVSELHTDFGIEVQTGPQSFASHGKITSYIEEYRVRLRRIKKELSSELERSFQEGNMEFVLNLWWPTREYQEWASSVGKDLKRICLLKRPFSDYPERYNQPNTYAYGRHPYGDEYVRDPVYYWMDHLKYPRGTEEEEKGYDWTPLVASAKGHPIFFVSAPHHPTAALGMFHAGCYPKGDHDQQPSDARKQFEGATNIVMKFAAFPRTRTAGRTIID